MKQTEGHQKTRNSIVPLFEPESLAVVGSFKEERPGGYRVIKTCLLSDFKARSILLIPSTTQFLIGRFTPA